MAAQVLDSMDIERERELHQGAKRLIELSGSKRRDIPAQYHRYTGPCRFLLRSVTLPVGLRRRALVVDAVQGVEAQSVANCYTAVEEGLEVIPVLNKIDLPSAEPERVQQEVEEIIGIDASEALRVSAKTGLGVEDCWSRSLNCRHLRFLQ